MNKKLKVLLGLLLSCMALSLPVKSYATEIDLDAEVLLVDDVAFEEPPLAEGKEILIEGEPRELTTEELIELGIIDESDVSEFEVERTKASFANYSSMTQSEICDDLEKKIRSALWNGETSIDLAGSGLNRNDHSYLSNIGYYCPYADGISLSMANYYWGNGEYAYIAINNSMNVEETRARINRVDAIIQDYIDSVSGCGDSDIDIALKLHDEIAVRCSYSSPIVDSSYYPYEMYINHNGVCQAYAYMYMYLLTKLDVESGYISSKAINHAWNVVKIDGNYYHVDITWDDPTSDKFGKVRHVYYLVSDSTMGTRKANGSSNYHTGWEQRFSCNSGLYDNAFWYTSEVSSPIIRLGDSYYYISNSNGYLTSFDMLSNSEKSILSVGYWHSDTGGIWNGVYSGLFECNNILYFNTYNAVKTYDPSTASVETFATVDTSSGELYGIRRNGRDIQYVILPWTPNTKWTTYYTLDKKLDIDVPASWSISDDTLTITGDIDDYSDYAPWYDRRDDFESVEITSGVKTIGKHAFYGCTNITNIHIAGSDTKIADASALQYEDTDGTVKWLDATVSIPLGSAAADWALANKAPNFMWDSASNMSVSIAVDGTITNRFSVYIGNMDASYYDKLRFIATDIESKKVIANYGYSDAVRESEMLVFYLSKPLKETNKEVYVQFLYGADDTTPGIRMCENRDYSVDRYMGAYIMFKPSETVWRNMFYAASESRIYFGTSTRDKEDVHIVDTVFDKSWRDAYNTDKANVSQSNVKAKEISGNSTKVEYIGSSVVLDSITSIRHYFRVNDSSVNSCKIGDEIVELHPAGGNVYYAEIYNIPPSKYDCVFNTSIDGLTIKYSVNSYLYDALGKGSDSLKELAKALYLFGDAAKTQFVVD